MVHRKLNRTSAHRWALRRNLAQSLFEHGEVRTTLPKAKDLRPFAERLITLAKKARGGSVTARRQIHKLLSDRSMVPAEHQEAFELMSPAKRGKTLRNPSGRRYRTGEPKGRLAFTGESVVHRLIDKVAARFETRDGGYTRVIRLAQRRLGDQGELAIVQLVGDEKGPGPVTRGEKTARRKRSDARYALAIKVSKARVAAKRTTEATAPDAEAEASAPAGAESATPSAEAAGDKGKAAE